MYEAGPNQDRPVQSGSRNTACGHRGRTALRYIQYGAEIVCTHYVEARDCYFMSHGPKP